MKMDDKPNPNLPMYRESSSAPSETGEPRGFLAYLEGTRVVPCSAYALAARPGGFVTEHVLRRTTLKDTVITTRFSSTRLDMASEPSDEPLWFETTIHRLEHEGTNENLGYYKTYEEALNGHGKAVRLRMEIQGTERTIID